MTENSAGPRVVTNSFSETLPPTVGAVFGTMTATNGPTSWSITNGNFNGYFAIDNSGGISAQAPATASATNWLRQSQNFETTWNLTPYGGSGTAAIGTAATAAPDGTNTGELIGEDTTNAKHGIFQSVAGATATTYTLSLYAKAQIRTRILMEIDDAAITAGAYVVFDLAGVQIGDPGGSYGSGWRYTNATITDVGNGWRRCTLTGVAGGATIGCMIRADAFPGGGPSVGFYLWGAQLDAASNAGPYVRTTTDSASQSGQPPGVYSITVQATNAAGSGSGIASITAAGPPSITPASFNFNTPQSTGYTVGTLTATGSPTSWAITGGDSANLFAISNTGVITTRQAVSGAGSETLSITATNANGSSAPATIPINWSVASAGARYAPLKIGGGGFSAAMQIAPDGTMVTSIDVGNGYVTKTNSNVWTPLLNPSNAPGQGTIWGFGNGNMTGGQAKFVGNDCYCLSVAPSNTQVIYVLWMGRMIVSQDRGSTWTVMSNFPAISYTGDSNTNDATPYSQKIQTIAKPGVIRRQGSLRGCPPLPSMRRLGEA
jgi:hypothetical protein